MKRLMVFFAMLGLLLSSSTASAAYYPSSGDFWYNGGNYADSYLRWASPGPFSHGDVGYEHDLDLGSSFANACTAWTNLPSGYDDCPTMGDSDPPGRAIASFGSFHINNVAANTSYFGSWTLKKQTCGPGCYTDPQGSTSANLLGQEVERRFCFFDNIWCMGAIRTQTLSSAIGLSVGSTTYRSW